MPLGKLVEHDVQRAEVGRIGVQEQRLARNADRMVHAQCTEGLGMTDDRCDSLDDAVPVGTGDFMRRPQGRKLFPEFFDLAGFSSELFLTRVHDDLAIQVKHAEVKLVIHDRHNGQGFARCRDATRVAQGRDQPQVIPACQRLDTGHDPLGALDRRRIRQLDVEQQIPFVLLRDEPCGRVVELPVRQHQETAVER